MSFQITCEGQRDDAVQPHLVEVSIPNLGLVAVWVIARNVIDVMAKLKQANEEGLNVSAILSVEEWPAHARRDSVKAVATVL